MVTLHISNDLLVGGTLEELREEGEVRNWPVVAEVKWIQRCLFEDRSQPFEDGADMVGLQPSSASLQWYRDEGVERRSSTR